MKGAQQSLERAARVRELVSLQRRESLEDLDALRTIVQPDQLRLERATEPLKLERARVVDFKASCRCKPVLGVAGEPLKGVDGGLLSRPTGKEFSVEFDRLI
jgi:hypothetical protein